MEFSGSGIKKIYIYILYQKKGFLIFPETKPLTFQPGLKNEKILPWENFLYCKKRTPEKFSYIFLKESYSYISGNGNTEKITYFSGKGAFLYFGKLLIFQEVTSRAWIMKKPSLKRLLIFQEVTCKAWKSKKFYTFPYQEEKFSKSK